MRLSSRRGIGVACALVLLCGCKLKKYNDTDSCVGATCETTPDPAPQCAVTADNQGDPMTIAFADPVEIVTKGAPVAMTAGDFNADGFVDLALTEAGSILFYAGDGTGKLADPVTLTAEGRAANGLRAGDVDGDGNEDLLVANQTDTVDMQATVFTGTAAIWFGGPAFPELPVDLVVPVVGAKVGASVALGDYDGDGLVDVIGGVLSFGGFVAFNQNDRTFTDGQALGLTPPPMVADVHAADLDGDGLADIAGISQAGFGFNVFRGKKDRTFVAETVGNVFATGPRMAMTDLDGDKRPELVMAAGQEVVYVVWNDGKGKMSTDSLFCVTLQEQGYSNTAPFGLGVADFDGDGRRDIVVTDGYYHGLSFLGGASSHRFRLPRYMQVSSGPAGSTGGPGDLVVADFNGDKKPDLAYISAGGFTLLLNEM